MSGQEIDPTTEKEQIETTKEQEESEGTFGDIEAGPDLSSEE